MGILDNLMANPQTQQQLQDFANRYQQGAPHEGYSDQEVMQRYQQVAPQLPQQDYVAAAEQAFEKMSQQQRQQFGQFVQQQAQAQGTAVPGFGQGVSPEMYQNANYLAQQAGQLHQQQPGRQGRAGGHRGDGRFEGARRQPRGRRRGR
jgi:hypothetical protein